MGKNETERLLTKLEGTKKTKAVLMIMAAICYSEVQKEAIARYAKLVQFLADDLEVKLRPQTAAQCWGRGAAFSLAMEQAKKCVIGTVQ